MIIKRIGTCLFKKTNEETGETRYDVEFTCQALGTYWNMTTSLSEETYNLIKGDKLKHIIRGMANINLYLDEVGYPTSNNSIILNTTCSIKGCNNKVGKQDFLLVLWHLNESPVARICREHINESLTCNWDNLEDPREETKNDN